MPSRKRAKGRERKLKQQAREPVERSVSQPPPSTSPNSGYRYINIPEQIIRRIEHAKTFGCDHGGFKTPQGHPASDFIDSFIETVTSENCSVSTIAAFLKIKFEEHPEVYQDFAVKDLAIDTIVSIGTHFILEKCIENARQLCKVIIFLEHLYEGTFDSAFSKGTEEVSYILNAEEREVVRFYKKRISCSCLDEMYSEIKKCQVRGGQCFHCKQTVKSKDLKSCNRCKSAYYCSKDCQISDWPSHKEFCDHQCSIPKSVKEAKTARKNEEG